MIRILVLAAALLAVAPARAEVIGGRPSGCPRQFCGCGAALYVYGRHVRDLWLARNWYRFPRVEPGPGMVGVRAHHVFVLQWHVGGDVWMVHDSNSGGGRTRLHKRSIRGYAIVNPNGGSWHGS